MLSTSQISRLKQGSFFRPSCTTQSWNSRRITIPKYFCFILSYFSHSEGNFCVFILPFRVFSSLFFPLCYFPSESSLYHVKDAKPRRAQPRKHLVYHQEKVNSILRRRMWNDKLGRVMHCSRENLRTFSTSFAAGFDVSKLSTAQRNFVCSSF